jgi:superfamily II DNA or RNA helicase
MLTLRPYQEAALQAVVENLQAGIRQQALVLSTGTGKTVIAAQLPAVLKTVGLHGKMVFIAHRGELLTQAMDKIGKWNPTLKIGLEKAESHADPDCDVVVACNASIGRKGSTRMAGFWQDVSVIVIDEMHHSAADSYLNILEDSGVLLPDSKKVLIGITATPKRSNRVRTTQTGLLDDEGVISLKSIFKKIVFNYPLRKAIKEGYLVPLHGFRISTGTNLNEVKTTAGDFAVDQLSNAVNTPDRNKQIVKAWKENINGAQTACFTVGIAHAQALATMFVSNGVKAQAIWGDDKDRAEKLAQFEAGEITVLCNCALLVEGWDSPSVACIVLARPTKSGTLYTQMIGRGTRLHPGKTSCTVLDVLDSYKKCSLVTLPSLLGLNPLLDLHGGSVTEAAEKMEALTEKYPSVDLSHLTDLSKVKAYVMSLDLFAEPYPQEVIELSKLTWMPAVDDSYTLAIPESKDIQGQYSRYIHERLCIMPNELGEFVLSITTTQTNRQLGVYNTLPEAFASADEVVLRCRASRLPLLLREAAWHSRPASDAAIKALRRLGKGNPVLMAKIDTGITSGECSAAINKLKARKG